MVGHTNGYTKGVQELELEYGVHASLSYLKELNAINWLYSWTVWLRKLSYVIWLFYIVWISFYFIYHNKLTDITFIIKEILKHCLIKRNRIQKKHEKYSIYIHSKQIHAKYTEKKDWKILLNNFSLAIKNDKQENRKHENRKSDTNITIFC